jgi:Tol biopolymer transport system component
MIPTPFIHILCSAAAAATLIASSPAQVTTRLSVDALGGQANQRSGAARITPDARFVVFNSFASNLVPGDTNGVHDVFVLDRTTRAVERVSVSSSGAQANGTSYNPSISADGRYVTFHSNASNLVPGDSNGKDDVFLHDRLTGSTGRVSVTYRGEQVWEHSQQPVLSADGRFIAFQSWASGLVPGDTNIFSDVFVRDLTTGALQRVSVSSTGAEGNADSLIARISAHGRFVAFSSFADNLVPGDTNGCSDVFVHDRSTGSVTRISVDSAGVQGNQNSSANWINADGRLVLFSSRADNLVPGDTNGTEDIFLRDTWSGTTERISVGPGGVEGDGHSHGGDMTPDGRYVAFYSWASNLVPGDLNGITDAFVHDRQSGECRLISRSSEGAAANVWSTEMTQQASISADGRFVTFDSVAASLVPGDTNGVVDIFLHDRDGIRLSIAGTVPGNLVLTTESGTPLGRVAVLYGAAGALTSAGPHCLGITIRIGAPSLGVLLIADANGAATRVFFAPPAAAGLSVQAVDLTRCQPSNSTVL